MAKKKLIIRSFHSFSGGAGKTTLSSSFATYYSQKKFDVIVIDTDFSGLGYQHTLYCNIDGTEDMENINLWDVVCSTSGISQSANWDKLKDDLLEITFTDVSEKNSYSHFLLPSKPSKLENLFSTNTREVLHSNLLIGTVISKLSNIIKMFTNAWFEKYKDDKNKNGVVVVIDCSPFLTGVGEEIFLWMVWLCFKNKWPGIKCQLKENLTPTECDEKFRKDKYEFIESLFDEFAFLNAEINNSNFSIELNPYIVIHPDPLFGYPDEWNENNSVNKHPMLFR